MFTPFQEFWHKVESNLHSARLNFQTADSTEDFQAVGVQCRDTILSLGEAVMEYQQLKERPLISNQTIDLIFEKFFNEQFSGSSKDQFRVYTKSCLKVANALQHDRTSTYLQATLCVEATAHLVGLVDAIVTNEPMPVNKRFKKSPFASAEATFMETWIIEHFNTHPVAIRYGFTFKMFMYKRSEMILAVNQNNKEYTIKLKKPFWVKEANRVSADRLLDQFIVELLSEQMREEIIASGAPPT